MSTPTHILDAELQQYIETALWSSNADHLDPEGTGHAGNMLAHFDASDFAPQALASMRADLADFLASDDEGCQSALRFWRRELGEGQTGHDFWLTRNSHGCGFWDRFYNEPGEQFGRMLTAMAKPYGESCLYVGDGGLVYVA